MRKALLLFTIFQFITYNIKSQELISSLEYYDSQVQQTNLPIFNGLFYQDRFYRPQDNSTEFYNNYSSYSIGNIYSYNMLFSKIKLKYDLVNQSLVIQPQENSGNIGIELINQKIDSFEIDKTLFVNLNKVTKLTDDRNFYIKKKLDKNLSLYYYHEKKTKENIKNNQIKTKFEVYKEHFIVEKEGNYYEFITKKDLILIYPRLENEIESYYKSYTLDKDSLEFRISILRYISQIN